MSIGLVDTSTKRVHVFHLRRGQVTIRAFFTSVEEKLTVLQAREGTCIRILCAAVGDSCINICDKLRTVEYYLLDAKPWFIKTAVFPSSYIDVHIKETDLEYGNEADIKMDLDRSHVKDLKQKFAKMTCTFFPSLHLIFDKKELEDGKRLSDCNLTSGSVVPCISGERGRKLSFGTPYVHIPQNNLQGRGDGLTPAWRRATSGMWLEGKCCNKICVAYLKVVVMNQGFTDLDFINERYRCKCPMCYELVIPVAYGFNRCEFMTVGLKITLDCQYPQVARQDWQRLLDSYHRFVPKSDGWLKFKLASRELKPRLKFCVLCMSESETGIACAPCGHGFHASCLKEEGTCLQCIGERNMTAYQKYF